MFQIYHSIYMVSIYAYMSSFRCLLKFTFYI